MSREEPATWSPGTPALADLSEPAARAAAKWWADHVRHKTPKDNGEPLHGAFDAFCTRDVKVDEAAAQRFEDALVAEIFSDMRVAPEQGKTELILDEWKTGRISYNRARLSTDYHPDWTLSRAAEVAAGHPDGKQGDGSFKTNPIVSLLPWKSGSRISMVSVAAGAGYGERELPIWTTLEPVELLGQVDLLAGRPGPRVVDRWLSATYLRNGVDPGGRWARGGDPSAKLALVTFCTEAVEPRLIAHVLRGFVSVDCHYNGLTWPADVPSPLAPAEVPAAT